MNAGLMTEVSVLGVCLAMVSMHSEGHRGVPTGVGSDIVATVALI